MISGLEPARQTGLPWAAADTSPERYNAVESHALMTASSPDLDAVATRLAGSLASHLRSTAESLGLRIGPHSIVEATGQLLGVSAERTVACLEGSDTPPPTFTEESFEPQDYLHLVPEALRRALGQVMTPQPIVRCILRAAGYRDDEDILGRTLCDPACGSGVFLVEAVRTYLGALSKTGPLQADWYPRVVSRFVGIDVDPLACLFARFNVSLILSRTLISWMQAHPGRLPVPLPFHRCDTLETLAAELNGSGAKALPLVGSFDYVVGNPPYRKVSPLSSALRETFQASLYGHPNAYGMFLHAGIEMLRPGGRLGYIVPRSMLSGLYFQNLRRMIEERTSLEELSLLAERKNVFPQVLQGTMIIAFQKLGSGKISAADPAVRTAVIRTAADLGNGPKHVTAPRRQVTRQLNGTTVWFVSDQERTYSLLDKILGRHPLLGGPVVACPAKTGPIVWNRVKPYLRPHGGDGTLPLVWATDVGRFRFALATASDTRPAYLEETQKTRGLATVGPSVLVQRVTADEQARRIVAGLSAFPSRQRYFVENHLNLLQPAPASRVDLHYLLGILSSDVVEFLFRSMNGNTQVSATELNLLPVPRGSFEAEISKLAKELEGAANAQERAQREGDLNERIASAYGLTGPDLSFLQRVLRENPALRDLRRDD